MRCPFRHLVHYFGNRAKVVTLGARIEEYVTHRREEGAADASIRIALALLDRGCRLAVEKKRLSPRSRPYIQKPADDESRVRKGFFRREAVERLGQHLPSPIAAVVLFLFFCPWRVGAARRLEWRDYSEVDQALTLRRELNKTKREMQIPVDPEHTPELMAVIERQQAQRRPNCPFIFPRPLLRRSSVRPVWQSSAMSRGFPEGLGPRLRRDRHGRAHPARPPALRRQTLHRRRSGPAYGHAVVGAPHRGNAPPLPHR